jgi:RND family efflux transporter MFP subunit
MSDSLPPDAAKHIAERSARRWRNGLLTLALVLALWGIGYRLHERTALAQETQAAALPVVAVIQPAIADKGETVDLPGSAQAYSEALIYARTSGYVKSWSADLGAHVKKGAILAEIETPDVDQQFRQAHADLATARAAYDIARTTHERWQQLLLTDSVSKQDAEQKAADAAQKKAAMQSAEANLARLRDLQGFQHIRAPFDGIVTQRAVEIGALVAAGQNAGTPLFKIADVHRLRIYTAVPESYAGQIKAGAIAQIAFDDHPGAHAATVTSTAGALDPTTRTLSVELQMDNRDGALLSGAYAHVRFDLGTQSALPRIPVTSLLFRSSGLWVATVPDGHRVALHKIVPGRDFGTEIEVVEGVGVSDAVVANPPDSLTDGASVRVVTATKAR